jgi:geranylgeranylglycerol-phosphate geranylgeranyltransferase
MLVVLKLLRPINCVMGIMGVLIGALVGKGLDVFQPEYTFELAVGMCIAFFFMGAGNMMNDYFDHNLDKRNHPERPIPSGKISAIDVIYTAGIIYFLLLLLGFLINITMFIILLLAIALMVGYEASLKRRGFIGNITIGILVGLLFMFGAAVVSEFGIVLFLSLLAALATITREIVKDIEDMEGDLDRRTLPKRLGARSAGLIAWIFIIIAVIISLLPAFPDLIQFIDLEGLNVNYFYLIVPADALLLLSMAFLSKSPSKASDTLKYGMIVALMAFALGSITI